MKRKYNKVFVVKTFRKILFLLLVLFTIKTIFWGCQSLPWIKTRVSVSTHINIDSSNVVEVHDFISIPKTTRALRFNINFNHQEPYPTQLAIRQLSTSHIEEEVFDTLDDEFTPLPLNDGFLSWNHSPSSASSLYELRYEYNGLIQSHTDVAQLHYYLWRPSKDIRIQHWDVEMHLPHPDDCFEENDILGWFRGNVPASLSVYAGPSLVFKEIKKAQREDNYIHLLFPVIFLDDDCPQKKDFSLFSIIESEHQAEETQKNRVKASRDSWMLAFILLIFAFLYLYGQWQKNVHTLDKEPGSAFSHELPQEYRAAELGMMWRFGHHDVRDIVATLFQLAIEGYLFIQEYVLIIKEKDQVSHKMDYRFILTEKLWENLQHYEQMMLQAFFRQFSENGRTISLFELQKGMHHKSSIYREFCKQWHFALKKRTIILRFFDQSVIKRQRFTRNIAYIFLLLGISFIMLLLFRYSTDLYLFPLPISFIIIGISSIIISGFYKKRTKKTEQSYQKYHAYHRYLSNLESVFSSILPPSVFHWNNSLPYTIVWQGEEDFLRQLQVLYAKSDTGEIFGTGFYSTALTENQSYLIYRNMLTAIQHMVDAFQICRL